MDFPRVGETVAQRFRIDAVLARGGMGLVFKATQLALNRPVALKILLPSQLGDTKSEGRFLREVEIIQGLAHPNIVTIFDHGTHGELLYIAMELLEGVDLSDYLKEHGPLSQGKIYRFSEQILQALCVAHRRGIVHRDIKASNVFVSHLKSQTDILKLLDFGIAKSLQDDAGLTGTGNVCGTTAYMAPEMLLGGELSLAVDVYALGLLIAEMALGRRVVSGSSLGHHLAAHTRGRVSLPPPLSDSLLEAIVVKACSRQVETRYRDAMAMLADLREAAPQCDPSLKIPRQVAASFHILPSEFAEELALDEGVTRDADFSEVEAFLRASMDSIGTEKLARLELEQREQRSDARVDEIAADSTGHPRSTALPDTVRPEAESTSETDGNRFVAPVDEHDSFNHGRGDAARDDPLSEPVEDAHEAEEGGLARKWMVVVVLALVLVGAGLGGWIYHAASASPDLRWTSGEEVVEVLKAEGWNLAPPTVEQSSQREVWRIVAFKSGESVIVRVFVCRESSMVCFDSGSGGTWLKGSSTGIQILAGPGSDGGSVDAVVEMLAAGSQSVRPPTVGP